MESGAIRKRLVHPHPPKEVSVSAPTGESAGAGTSARKRVNATSIYRTKCRGIVLLFHFMLLGFLDDLGSNDVNLMVVLNGFDVAKSKIYDSQT